MGSGASLSLNDFRAICDFPRDYRVNRCIKTFQMPEEKVTELWRLFLKYDRGGTGKITLEDYFNRLLVFPRSKITDSMFHLIDTMNDFELTFGEFFEVTCTFSCFEKKEMFEYLFFVLDPLKTGTVDKNELLQLIADFYDKNPNTNVKMGLEYLEEMDDGDGQYNFSQIWEVNQKYPSTFASMGRLQQQVITRSLGEWWWATHKARMLEERESKQEKELDMIKKQQIVAEIKEQQVNDDLVEQRMGYWKFHLMPWRREIEREKISKMLALESDLDDFRNKLDKTDHEESITMLLRS